MGFGNVLAGYIAKQMGLPIRKLGVSTNENIVLDHFFKTGLYTQKDVVVTSSPSMDISKASNIERLFFDILNFDKFIVMSSLIGILLLLPDKLVIIFLISFVCSANSEEFI